MLVYQRVKLVDDVVLLKGSLEISSYRNSNLSFVGLTMVNQYTLEICGSKYRYHINIPYFCIQWSTND
jgi:hypothetical protein